MKKYFKCIVMPLLFLVLVGCNKEIKQTDFVEFSKNAERRSIIKNVMELHAMLLHVFIIIMIVVFCSKHIQCLKDANVILIHLKT